MKHKWCVILLSILPLTIHGQGAGKYTQSRPLVIVCDWDKPPYEFSDDEGKPAGSNVDVISKILTDLDIPFIFIMKEWSHATKTFQRGDADLIFANVNRYKGEEYHATQIINYNRIRVAMTTDTTGIITINTLENEGAVLKTGDYTGMYFKDADSVVSKRIEYLSPKVALTGLVNGDNKYFVWGEEPLKWKIKKLNLEGIYLNDVAIPVSEVHIIGRDKELIDLIDDHYSRLKQSGELEVMLDKWFHPEKVHESTPVHIIYIILALLLLGILIFLLYRLARIHVRNATRSSTMMNEMMDKALHMGSFQVMEYDIAHDLFTNSNGSSILPARGLSLKEFTQRIHPDQRQEFEQKMQLLLTGRERRFELNKKWNAGTDDAPQWLIFNGHAISELDDSGHPVYVVNAIHDVTHEVEEDMATSQLNQKYEQLKHMPFVGISFYDKNGWLLGLNDAMKHLCHVSDDNPESKRYWESACMFDVPLFRELITPQSKDSVKACQHMLYPDLGIDNYVEVQIQPLLDVQGDIVSYCIATVDVTEERNIVHAIHEKRRRIRQTDKEISILQEHQDFLLANSNRKLVTDEQGRQHVITDNSKLETARRLLREETQRAEQSVQLKSGFMASMTHELRTPLNAIVGFTSILEQISDPDERQEYTRIIRNSSDMLQRLINDIIEASSMTDGPTSIMLEDVNFVTAFDDICLTLQQRIQNSDVQFIKDNPYETFYTTLDIERIQQVLTNFVTNAVKFTQKGYIRVGYRYENHGLNLYCEDTGMGIPKDKQEQIFDRFVKLDEFVQGTGMGLAICKSIAERFNGKIGVSSEGLEKGSLFWMWIPCERKIRNKKASDEQ